MEFFNLEDQNTHGVSAITDPNLNSTRPMDASYNQCILRIGFVDPSPADMPSNTDWTQVLQHIAEVVDALEDFQWARVHFSRIAQFQLPGLVLSILQPLFVEDNLTCPVKAAIDLLLEYTGRVHNFCQTQDRYNAAGTSSTSAPATIPTVLGSLNFNSVWDNAPVQITDGFADNGDPGLEITRADHSIDDDNQTYTTASEIPQLTQVIEGLTDNSSVCEAASVDTAIDWQGRMAELDGYSDHA